jgi:hypothetical protein
LPFSGGTLGKEMSKKENCYILIELERNAEGCEKGSEIEAQFHLLKVKLVAHRAIEDERDFNLMSS